MMRGIVLACVAVLAGGVSLHRVARPVLRSELFALGEGAMRKDSVPRHAWTCFSYRMMPPHSGHT